MEIRKTRSAFLRPFEYVSFAVNVDPYLFSRVDLVPQFGVNQPVPNGDHQFLKFLW